MLNTATINLYLRALDKMTQDLADDSRVFARRALRDLGEKGVNVSEYLEDWANLPKAQLRGPEIRLRQLVEHSPHAGYPTLRQLRMRVDADAGAVVTC